jgi:hypothetical protein
VNDEPDHESTIDLTKDGPVSRSEIVALSKSIAATGARIASALAEQATVTQELATEKRITRRQFRIVLLVVALSALVVLAGQWTRGQEADMQVRIGNCQKAIDSAAEGVRDERDTIVSEALVAYAVRGRPTGLVERALKVDELNRRLDAISELRDRSTAACTENPDLQPP